MIRQLEASDLEAFKFLRLMSLEIEPENYASTHAEWAALTDEDWAGYLVSSDVFAAFDGARPVGLGALTPQVRERMAHRASLGMVFVVPERRGSRVAAAVMEALLERARERGLLQLELAVHAGNARAVRFYERFGFERYGLLPRGFREASGYVDDLLMVLALE
jgi:ribosomal protein S18 acetylase RimI-like enzyme